MERFAGENASTEDETLCPHSPLRTEERLPVMNRTVCHTMTGYEIIVSPQFFSSTKTFHWSYSIHAMWARLVVDTNRPYFDCREPPSFHLSQVQNRRRMIAMDMTQWRLMMTSGYNIYSKASKRQRGDASVTPICGPCLDARFLAVLTSKQESTGTKLTACHTLCELTCKQSTPAKSNLP